MEHEDSHQPLDQIATLWTVVCRAHTGSPDEANAAQKNLIHRYGRAVQRYLLGALRNPDAAEEVFQEFALRFVRGDFRRADPQRGRFRDFVKGILFHLIADHRRRQRKQHPVLPEGAPEPAAPAEETMESDRRFLLSWRNELLARCWEALSQIERRTGQHYYTVLRFRADHPEVRSAQLADHLTTLLKKPVSAAGARQLLHRAREKFSNLLVEEVMQTLEQPTVDRLEQELMDLNLLQYCRPALERLRQGS